MTPMTPYKPLLLSTEWAHFLNGMGASAFCRMARAMGFDQLDLGPSIMDDGLDGAALSELSIGSLHAPCFLPASALKGLTSFETELGALQPGLREEAIAAICHTIDLAQSLGIRAIAVHGGTLPSLAEASRRLVQLYDRGLCDSEEYARMREQVLEERGGTVEPHLAWALRSLKVIGEYAARAGVWVGLENRCEQSALPTYSDAEGLLDSLKQYPVGIWFDVGHAVVQENLGFLPHNRWLETFSDRIVGVHLHDVNGHTDHLPVGMGGVDWSSMIPRLPLSAVWVFEYSRQVDAGDVRRGLELVRDLL
jgi:sugar phosphate isomerase/epimerase